MEHQIIALSVMAVVAAVSFIVLRLKGKGTAVEKKIETGVTEVKNIVKALVKSKPVGHKTEVIEVQHLADTMVAGRLRCCGDESTDSVHTIEVSGDLAESDLQEWLGGRHVHVQGLHDKREKAKAFFESLKPSK